MPIHGLVGGRSLAFLELVTGDGSHRVERGEQKVRADGWFAAARGSDE